MHEIEQFDRFDLKLLAALQEDASLTNQELAGRVNLSPSQCSRRKARLEQDGIILRYTAVLHGQKLGLQMIVFVNVTLNTHSRDNSRRFKTLIEGIPAIREAHALTGDMDYLIKLIVPDLATLSEIVNDVLLPHDSVQHVRSSIALETLKEDGPLPLEYLTPSGL